ncbi:MAG: lipocalin-like domain-containing protein [Gemmatimonadaceae bacterium]
MIRRLKDGKYRLYSSKTDPKTGKRRNLGTFGTRAAAESMSAPCSTSSIALGSLFAHRKEYIRMTLSDALIGTWELQSRIDRTAAGERRLEPMLGEHPVALLYYDRSGHFAAQFMKRDRSTGVTTTQPSASTAAAPNNSRAQGGYDAYFGTYTVDDAQGTVTQTLLGALSAENVGLVLTRSMLVEGDRLTIALATATADGEPVTRTLVWRRLAPSS